MAVFAVNFLDFPLPITRYEVFANPPFNATAATVAKLKGDVGAADEAHLVMQREAAAKLLGERRESLATVPLKPWFEPAVTHRFRREDFAPEPGVEVVMLRLRKRGPPLIEPNEAGLYRDFVTHTFTAWQKTVRDALDRALGTGAMKQIERDTGIDLGRLPTAVPFEEWLALFVGFRSLGEGRGRRAVSGAKERLRGQQAGLVKVHRTRTPVRRR